MAEMIKWRNATVEIKASLVPRFLWITASLDVFLSGQCILRTGGGFKFKGACSNEFDHAGERHKVQVRWGVSGLWSFPYQLQIDNEVIAESRVYLRNWLFGVAFWFFVFILPLLVGIIALASRPLPVVPIR